MQRDGIAEELLKRYNMADHEENGSYLERHYDSTDPGRPLSGSIYYYVAPEERTLFHSIDCDEYWCYIAGSPLEIWQISPAGDVSTVLLGVGSGCEPLVYLKKGIIFASKHPDKAQEGAFLSCITIPRFQQEGFHLYSDEEIQKAYPETEGFFRE